MDEVIESKTLSNSEQANKVVRNYSLASIVPSLIPVPVFDLAAVAGIQLKMLHSLAKIYGVEFKEELSRSAIASLVGGTVSLSAARMVSSAVKVIPGLGSIMGAVTLPIISGGTSYAVGQVFIQHFETGGTLLTFDAAKVRNYFEQQFAEGKAIVADAVASGETDAAAPQEAK